MSNEPQFQNPDHPFWFLHRQDKVICVVCNYSTEVGVVVSDECRFISSDSTAMTPSGSSRLGLASDGGQTRKASRTNEGVRNTVRNRHFSATSQI